MNFFNTQLNNKQVKINIITAKIKRERKLNSISDNKIDEKKYRHEVNSVTINAANNEILR